MDATVEASDAAYRLSPLRLREAFGAFATGVTVVTGILPDGTPVGITANSFTSVSLTPPLLLWCLARDSGSAMAFPPGALFAVHILSHQQADLALHFARRRRDKFEIDALWRARPKPPEIADSLCRFGCVVQARHTAGDHFIIVGEVLDLQRQPGRPLAFHGGRFGTFVHDTGAQAMDVWEIYRDHWF